MATIKFYPYKKKGNCKIYVRLSLIRGMDFRLSSTLTIEDASTWNYETNFPKKNSENNKDLHKTLRDLGDYIEQEILEIEKSTTKSIRELSSKWLKVTILNFFNEAPTEEKDLLIPFASSYTEGLINQTYKKNGVRHPYKKNTIDKYRNIVKHLEKYQNARNTIFKIKDVDDYFADDFLNFCIETNGHSINTNGREVKRLKTFVKNADEKGIEVNSNYHLIQGFEDTVIVTFLNFDEIDTIIETEMPDARLQIAKEWLIIGCYTAQRVSDLYRMRKEMIINENGRRYITFKQFKTSVKVKVPIHYKVDDILSKYNDNFPPNLYTNEKSNRTKLSNLMKKVCEISGITEIVEGRLNGKKGLYPKFELIHNHSCRRSFCCNFYGLDKWTTPMIMEITGHKTEKSFYKYIAKDNFYLSERGADNFAEMKENDLKAKKNKQVLKTA